MKHYVTYHIAKPSFLNSELIDLSSNDHNKRVFKLAKIERMGFMTDRIEHIDREDQSFFGPQTICKLVAKDCFKGADTLPLLIVFDGGKRVTLEVSLNQFRYIQVTLLRNLKAVSNLKEIDRPSDAGAPDSNSWLPLPMVTPIRLNSAFQPLLITILLMGITYTAICISLFNFI